MQHQKGYVDWIFITIIGFAVVGVLVIGSAIYVDAHKTKFTLNVDEWECTKNATRLSIIPAGKVMVPSQSQYCVEYRYTK